MALVSYVVVVMKSFYFAKLSTPHQSGIESDHPMLGYVFIEGTSTKYSDQDYTAKLFDVTYIQLPIAPARGLSGSFYQLEHFTLIFLLLVQGREIVSS